MAEPRGTDSSKRMRLRYAGTCTMCGVGIDKGAWAIYDKATKTVRCEHHESTGPAVAAATPEPALPKLIKVRYAGPCTACGKELAKGVEAFWVKNTKVMVCPACTGVEASAGLGTSGGSAGRVADGAARAHAQRLLDAYPMLAEHLLENAEPTAVMRRWDRGADGERVVGRLLDHIVVGPRRITVIDAKHYRGQKVRTPKRDGERVLEVKGEPAQHLIDGVAAQRRAVEDAVSPELRGCVGAILAFVGADMGFTGGWSTNGVWCMSAKEAVVRASSTRVLGKWPYHLDADQRSVVAEQLARAFPSA